MEKELTEEVISGVEEELREERDAFTRAWNEGDVKTISSMFAEDAVRVGFYGEKSKGRKEIGAAFKNLKDNLPGSTLEFDKGELRMLADDLAVWQGEFRITRPGEASPIKGYVIQVSKKINGGWQILEAHPKLISKGGGGGNQ